MVHPLIPQLESLARPLAARLGYELVQMVFHTNQYPPVLRVDIRPLDPEQETSHADCEAMSQALEVELDRVDLIPGHYVLEVSSPGISNFLISDRDFVVFKGFAVEVTVDPPYKGKAVWSGHLLGRDEEKVALSLKGRRVQLPRASVQRVVLSEAETE
ncbi:ribosome maturation factor RimP [Synechococcus sp. W60.2]|uniref:ribosome maturation factor RimP n=1 Tax=unclassified Synechococcus TaxID=2626047 RepID=UPI0039C03BCA